MFNAPSGCTLSDVAGHYNSQNRYERVYTYIPYMHGYSGDRIIRTKSMRKFARIIHTSKSMGKYTIVQIISDMRISDGQIIRAVLYLFTNCTIAYFVECRNRAMQVRFFLSLRQMLTSQHWQDAEKREIDLLESDDCVPVFPDFLR